MKLNVIRAELYCNLYEVPFIYSDLIAYQVEQKCVQYLDTLRGRAHTILEWGLRYQPVCF